MDFTRSDNQAELDILEDSLNMYMAIRDSLVGCSISDRDEEMQKANERIRKIQNEIAAVQNASQQPQQQQQTTASRAGQSRKRDLESSSLGFSSRMLENPAKSRRMTPQPPSDFSSAADGENSPIDLTGDDDEILRDIRDRTRDNQRRVEEAGRIRREQEAKDRQLAIQLSNRQGEDESFFDEFDPRRTPISGPSLPTSLHIPPVNAPGALDLLQAYDNSHGLGGDLESPISIDSDFDGRMGWPKPSWSFQGISDSSSGNITPGLPGSYPFDRPEPVPQTNPFTTARSLMQQSMGDSQLDPDWMALATTQADFLNAPESRMGYDYTTESRATDEDIHNLLSNIGDADIPPEKREGTPEGLQHPLYPHQQVALSWMKKAENGTNKGGILADDMGLGKTISTTALMLARPSPDPKIKTNLIIGPVALIRQWEEELRDKVRHRYRFTVFLLHGQNKAPIDELLKYDIVLTTYGTIASQKKQLDKFLADNAGQNIDTKDDPFLATKCPLLHPHKAKFWRVILDEAQNIKNEHTKQSVACAAIMAQHRWCLTGTPMMNSVKELFSLIRFLRIKPYNDRTKFSETFRCLWDNGGSTTRAMAKLRALVKAVMLRRLKSSVIDGKPILQLPPKTENIVYARLTEEEQQFYDQLQHNSRVQFSKYLRAGTVGKNYSSILVLLLRLRQACCHPHLNLDVDEAPPVDGASAEELVKLARGLEAAVIRRIKENNEDSLECPICYDIAQTPFIMTPCGHYACKECLSSMYDVAARNRAQNDGSNDPKTIPCPYCKAVIDVDKSIPFPIFEQVHMPEKVAAEAAKTKEDLNSADSDTKSYSDSEFDSEFDSEYEDEDAEDADKYGNLRGFVVPDSDDEDDFKSKNRATKANAKGSKKKQRHQSSRNGKHKPKSSGQASTIATKASELKQLRAEATRNLEAKKRYFNFLSKHWLTSAKVEECVRLLGEFQRTGEKTIVFSQWTCLLDLLQVAMRKGGIGRACRYDGSMSAVARNESAHRFRNPDSREKVMLVSLKAGNSGLNLTAASRVVIMDPFWNPYVEMQAVDRAYRIGQTKEVQVFRILVKDTVEDRIIALQDRKKELVESALDEAGGKAIGRLSTAELKFMFGL